MLKIKLITYQIIKYTDLTVIFRLAMSLEIESHPMAIYHGLGSCMWIFVHTIALYEQIDKSYTLRVYYIFRDKMKRVKEKD